MMSLESRPKPALNGARVAFAVLLCTGLAAGCTSSGSIGGMSDFTRLFGSGSSSNAQADATSSTPASSDVDCPTVEVRVGAGALSVMAGKGESAEDMRHQLSFGQMARECRVQGGVLTMRVGVQGRVVLGPKGTAGTVEAPLRFAVVREGPEPKTVLSKFYRVPVAVEPGQNNVAFTYVAEDIEFPMPSGDELDAYVVYVGFDAKGEPPAARKTPARRRS